MPVLNEAQVNGFYFRGLGGFPPAKPLVELSEYNGESKICVGCTQLELHHAYLDRSTRELKSILNEWVDFLRTNTTALTALHFNTRVPQTLFDAACCQKNLTELRCKWGGYADLSALEKLLKLQFLLLGERSGARDISVLGRLENLVVLELSGFTKIEDYSPLVPLSNLEQLMITGPLLGKTPLKDLEFLREMPNLRSLILGGISYRKKYSPGELADLLAVLPNLQIRRN